MATYNGTDLRVFLEGDLIAGEGECSISFSQDPREVNNKDSGRWQEYEEGMLGAEVSVSGMVIYPALGNITTLYDQLVASGTVTLVFGINDNGSVDTTEVRYSGEFVCTGIEDSGANRETRAFNATFISSGTVSRLPAAS
ncbi:MAG: phage tail protein [Ignavibacteria bacterium]|nr:phage tail protein [Ignavibacteria bacterium]